MPRHCPVCRKPLLAVFCHEYTNALNVRFVEREYMHDKPSRGGPRKRRCIVQRTAEDDRRLGPWKVES